jgi:hypothetical protein
MNAFGFRPAVRSHINTKLAFDASMAYRPRRRHVEPFGDDQEMVNERVHMLTHIVAVRKHDLWSVSFGRPGFSGPTPGGQSCAIRSTRAS